MDKISVDLLAENSAKVPKILVVGDLILDHYVWGNCSRISPEAPVQVVNIKKESENLGGSCNVANNLIELGAEVFLCGVCGDDAAGDRLLGALQKRKINTNGILRLKNRPTTQKTRIIAANQQVVRIDREDSSAISNEDSNAILEFTQKILKEQKLGAMVISDYNKGLLSFKLTQEIISSANELKVPVLCDPKGSDFTKYKGAFLLTPNKKEAQIATGVEIKDEKSLENALDKMGQSADLCVELITLSEDGMAFKERKGGICGIESSIKSSAKADIESNIESGVKGKKSAKSTADSIKNENKIHKIPTIAREVFDVSGAGDTVIAALAWAIANGAKMLQAAQFANAAAAVVVSKIGSATASHAEIAAYLRRNKLDRADFTSKFVSLQELQNELKIPQNATKRVVFTNGCFDILHFGHIDYLNKARKLGDLLIVGLNSDKSVKELKGKARPINPQNDRALMLCALECVDFVVLFDELTPRNLIAAIAPNVLVKGGDYKGKEVVGAEFAERVELIDFVENRSTSVVIEKILKNYEK